jgi:hypothetical protein
MTVANRTLIWRDDKLCFRGREYARIVPDATYPNMWRVQTRDGCLSSMASHTRARDAARGIVLALLNGQETPPDTSQTRVSALGAPEAPPSPEKATSEAIA